jgi:glycerol-3-phosphate dehydrogenase (NAD(P)+)
MNRVTVIGAGGWGTALATVLAAKGPEVRLWGYDAAHIRVMREKRENPDYLPGVRVPENVCPLSSLEESVEGAELVLFVTPSKAMREVAGRLFEAGNLPPGVPLLSCTKGIEHGTGLRMSEILEAAFPSNPVAVLSGPSHAEEVARGVPSAVVIGARDLDLARRLQECISTGAFRAYRSDDVAGIELGGALKNVYALAAGISDGLGLGDNTKAALLTRSLAEMVRLGVSLGGRRETFYGLSGAGDLTVTCFSRHSRNRAVGERIGKGESLKDIIGSMRMVAEGVPTTRSARDCARRQDVAVPVIDEVYRVLYEGSAPDEALHALMNRDLRPEEDPV